MHADTLTIESGALIDVSGLGYAVSDCHPELRTYDYPIEDCHWDAVLGRRFIYDDFAPNGRVGGRGLRYLLLTHPGYWGPSGADG